MFLFLLGFFLGIMAGQEWEKLPNLLVYFMNLKNKIENLHINKDNNNDNK